MSVEKTRNFLTEKIFCEINFLKVNSLVKLLLSQKFWQKSVPIQNCSFQFQVFLAVEVPLCIIVVLHMISSTWYDFLNYQIIKSVVLVVNLLISLSYPLNFGIYCGMSRQFRETFKELFIHRVGRRGSPSLQMVSVNSCVLHSVKI